MENFPARWWVQYGALRWVVLRYKTTNPENRVLIIRTLKPNIIRPTLLEAINVVWYQPSNPTVQTHCTVAVYFILCLYDTTKLFTQLSNYLQQYSISTSDVGKIDSLIISFIWLKINDYSKHYESILGFSRKTCALYIGYLINGIKTYSPGYKYVNACISIIIVRAMQLSQRSSGVLSHWMRWCFQEKACGAGLCLFSYYSQLPTHHRSTLPHLRNPHTANKYLTPVW